MRTPRASALPSILVDAAAILVVWGGALLAEDVALGFLWRDQFSGPWEIAQARHLLAPIALAALAPVALVVAAGWRLARAAGQGSRGAAQAFAAPGAGAALALGLGVTEGRHFASWGLRAPFVLLLTLLGAAAGRWGMARVARLARHPAGLGLVGLGTAVAGWTADAYVLPRLYPAFHVAMAVMCLLGGALAALGVRAEALVPGPRAAAPGANGGEAPPGPVALTFAGVVALLALVCAGAWPRAVRALERAANLRIVLVERAPLMGRAVTLAMALRPPDAIAGAGAAAGPATVAPGEVARSLDWGGHDLVLITVDALRADHVGAYGYARATTPNLDRLAAEGTRFDHAYCPTPHTSYSLSSMMTGKYLRPLLALGLGEDSETWAQHLRRYGWRTGAFYPPAVFFIDEDRFTRFEDEHLGFEYAKVEFADPALREQQVTEFVDAAPADRPLFLWVHFFEPHEPYVVHPEHVFSGGPSADVDAYDSEVATADDGIGRITRVVQSRRPGAVVLVTADHGEEFGEHGGRYHGTTVYDEQVRVPLVVVGAGVRSGQHVETVVQTIDLLPTALSALGIPRPARLRGRDLGSLLAGGSGVGGAGDARNKAADDGPAPGAPADGGRAFVETDDYELMASGPDRLICQRRAAACALYRPADDPLERRDVSAADPARFEALRALLRDVGRDHGRYETTTASVWPEPIRRGLQGEVDAAPDVAALLDDAEVTIRRKAAEVCFALHAPATAPEVARALAHDEDDDVRRWSALALVRMGEPMAQLAEALLRDPGREWRRAAALAVAERGDGRGCEELAAWWGEAAAALQPSASGEAPHLALELAHARELLAAIGKARCRAAVPALVRSLEDVRARPYVADTLGALGDDRARAPLLAALGSEPYVTTRPREARALLALGVRDWAATSPAGDVHAVVAAPAGPARLVVLLSDPHAELAVVADGEPDATPDATPVAPGATPSATAAHPRETVRETDGEIREVELRGRGGQGPGATGAETAAGAAGRAAAGAGTEPRRVRLELHASTGSIVALWVIPVAPAAPAGRLD